MTTPAQPVYETTTEALAPTANFTAQDPAPLESNPPVSEAQDILSDYWERTTEAADANGGVSGNQDAPSYQAPTQILQTPQS